MDSKGKYEDIGDGCVIIYIMYQMIKGAINWQDYSEQTAAWFCLILLLLYCLVICTVETEREMINRYWNK